MGTPLAIIRELDVRIGQMSAERRALTARHLTDLFLVTAAQFSVDDIGIIDDIFVRLAETIEESARALLAIRLGPVAGATMRSMSHRPCLGNQRG